MRLGEAASFIDGILSSKRTVSASVLPVPQLLHGRQVWEGFCPLFVGKGQQALEESGCRKNEKLRPQAWAESPVSQEEISPLLPPV